MNKLKSAIKEAYKEGWYDAHCINRKFKQLWDESDSKKKNKMLNKLLRKLADEEKV